VATTHWSFDGGASGTGTSVNVTAEGDWTLRFYSVDNAGNTEGVKTASFAVENAPTALSVVSVAGDDRIATAIAAAKVAFPSGAGTVVIATARNWPDALGGAALAGAVDGPILLTEPTELPSTVATAISALGATKAIILGGTGAVSSDVQSALGTTLGGAGNVTRIDGADRYETARKVAAETVKRINESGTFSRTAFVATGANFPDALAASPLAAAKGWPIYLVRPTGVDDALVDAMRKVGVNQVIILGGYGAVPKSVEDALKVRVAPVSRLEGADRYRTALAVAEHGVKVGLFWDKVAVATGANFPDALAGGVLQGRANSVMVLTPSDTLHEGVRQTLVANKGGIWEVRFLGGLSAVSQPVRDAAIGALQ
jgi:putative cell wall-binding protein